MTRLLLLALLSADPAPGVTDSPVLIQLDGSRRTITGVEPLDLGTVCLSHDKAASIRDDLADKNARVASLEASLSTNWPLVAIVAGVGVLLVGGAAAAGFVAGQKSR